MASLQERQRKNGKAYLIQFKLNGERRSLFLDVKYNREMAEEIKGIVEKCVDAIETDNPLDRRTLAWLEHVNADLRDRLIQCGLVEADETDSRMTLGELYDLFLEDIERRRKRQTVRNYDSSQKVIFRLIDPATRISDFTKKDALDFASRLAETKYSLASRHTFLVALRIVFNWAIEHEFIDKNPLKGIEAGNRRNKNREFYVDAELFEKMLEGCRSAQERALLTFYRIAGMRRSEALLVRWRDVDFKNGRLLVHSPKTERIEGKETRIIPLFPKLRAAIQEVRSESTDISPDDKIIQIKPTLVWNLFYSLMKRRGLIQYPRLIQNLRSSASIDIYRRYGEIAENAWLGHTFTTAKEHYLHVLESDFQKALEG